MRSRPSRSLRSKTACGSGIDESGRSLLLKVPVGSRPPGRSRRKQSILSMLRAGARTAGEAGGAHHVHHAHAEAQQQEHDHAPGRDMEPAVDQPAHQGPDEHASHELGRKPKAAGEPRGIGSRRRSRARILRPARADAVEPFAEAPQPRRESSLVGGSGTRILIARVHHCDTANAGKSGVSATPKAARTILTGYPPVKNSHLRIKQLMWLMNHTIRDVVRARSRASLASHRARMLAWQKSASRELSWPPSIIIFRCSLRGPTSATRRSWRSCAAMA